MKEAALSRGPMPTVSFQGQIYSLRSPLLDVPDLKKLDTIAALMWLMQNTTRRGYQKSRALIACAVIA